VPGRDRLIDTSYSGNRGETILWGREVREKLGHEEEAVQHDAVFNKYCSCFSARRKGMVMRCVRHDLKKNASPADALEVRYLVLLTRARFYSDKQNTTRNTVINIP
jgi:hypothetical protein